MIFPQLRDINLWLSGALPMFENKGKKKTGVNKITAPRNGERLSFFIDRVGRFVKKLRLRFIGKV